VPVLGERLGGVPVSGEELDDGVEVQHLVLTVDGGALGRIESNK
jgi:hypothetical protein